MKLEVKEKRDILRRKKKRGCKEEKNGRKEEGRKGKKRAKKRGKNGRKKRKEGDQKNKRRKEERVKEGNEVTVEKRTFFDFQHSWDLWCKMIIPFIIYLHN